MLAQHRQRELHKPPADILLSYSCFIPGRSCTASHAQFSPPTSVLRSWLLGMLSLPWLVSLEQFVASHSLPLALLSEPPSTTPARLEVLSAAHIGTTSSSPRHWLNDKKKNWNILHSDLGKQQQNPPPLLSPIAARS